MSVQALTAKQEAFAQAIADGKTQADAYRAAYSAGGMSDNAIYREASLLLGRPKVSQRVAALRETLASKAMWTREMSVKALVKAYRVAEESRQSAGMTGAIRELNAMHGYNEPVRIDHMSSDGSMTPIDASRLSDATLQELLSVSRTATDGG